MIRAILTVIGKDRVGIIAGVSVELARLNINILDVSQTIMNDYFTMMMMCDIAQAKESINTIQEKMNVKGDELGVKIMIQREDIFTAMHKL
ncbi:MAG: ACT domain-containing protein [Burkholderiales bacterium]|jgi:ACT domain-containing protein|nr:ACT domain-containing protein [Burkholderiales bacterium]